MTTNLDDLLTFGTDPEYFIVEEKEGKEFAVPVPHFIENLGFPEVGYDKDRKHPVIYRDDKIKVMMDGVAAEFTVPPAKTAKDLYSEIRHGLDWLDSFATSFGYKTSTKPTVFYNFYDYFREGNRALEWCGEFGCDPDEDAIDPEYKSPTIDVRNHPYRYGGGHLHLSDNHTLLAEYPVPAIRMLAIFCGNFSIVNSPHAELENLRAFKYGQPGRFRVQRYIPGVLHGVEYRSPSNAWTTSLESIEGMMHWTKVAYSIFQHPDRAVAVMDKWLPDTITAIRTCDKALASYILEKATL